MAITFKAGWNSTENNDYFIQVPGDPDNWRDKGKKLRANESNIETIIGKIPGEADSIKGDHISDVINSIKTGGVEVVKGIHNDSWSSVLGKHITVQLGDPYLDIYHLYGQYYLKQFRWIVTYISKGIPLKINY